MNNNESCHKTSINWYPGHMAKAKREIEENLKIIDVVLELVDARIPISSRNPDIDKIVGTKPRIILLNKSDLADENKNNEWIKYFASKGINAICTDANSGKGLNEVKNMVLKLMESKLEQYLKKGIKNKVVRVAILGIPNVRKIFSNK